MTYIEDADIQYTIAYNKLKHFDIMIKTLEIINPKLIRSYQYLYKQLLSALEELHNALFIHNSALDPTEEMINSVIESSCELKALLYNIESDLNDINSNYEASFQ